MVSDQWPDLSSKNCQIESGKIPGRPYGTWFRFPHSPPSAKRAGLSSRCPLRGACSTIEVVPFPSCLGQRSLATAWRTLFSESKSTNAKSERIVALIGTAGEDARSTAGPGPFDFAEGQAAGATLFWRRGLVHSQSAAGLAFSHQEYKGNHGKDADGEQAEIVEIGEHGGLPLEGSLD